MAATAALTSCFPDEPSGQIVTYQYGGESCFNRVTDTQTGEVFIGLNPSYSMTFDTSKKSVDVNMQSIQLSNTLNGLTFKLPTMSYEFNTQTAFIESSISAPVAPLNTGELYKFNSLRLDAAPGRIILDRLFPVYNLEYTVNDRYHVRVFPIHPVYVGTTSAVRDGGPAYMPADGEWPVFGLSINPVKNTATIEVVEARFEQSMPPFNFTVKDIPVKFTEREIRSTAAVTDSFPVMSTGGTTQLYKCTVTDVTISSDIVSGNTVIGFYIDLTSLGGTLNYGRYAVTANLGYFFKVGSAL